jgi:hypothetical protein
VRGLNPPPGLEHVQALLEEACRLSQRASMELVEGIATNDGRLGRKAGKDMAAALALSTWLARSWRVRGRGGSDGYVDAVESCESHRLVGLDSSCAPRYGGIQYASTASRLPLRLSRSCRASG